MATTVTVVPDYTNTALSATPVAHSIADILRTDLEPRLPASGTLSILSAADVNAEVDAALNTAIPGSPTAGSVNDVLKDLDARLPGSGTLSTLAAADVNAEVDTALNTAIPGVPTAGSVNDVLKDLDARLPASGTLVTTDDITPVDISVPAADSTDNVDVTDVVGNKTDAAVTAVGTTKSAIAYLKGLITNIQIHGTQEYTSGSGNFTVPAGVYSIDVLMVAGGGGGGGSVYTTEAANGGGGGGGAFAILRGIQTVPGATLPYSVGAAGAGATGSGTGSSGGNTTFMKFTARGGAGGVGATNRLTGVGGEGGTMKSASASAQGTIANAVDYGGHYISGGGNGSSGNSSSTGGHTDYASGGAAIQYCGGGGASFNDGASAVGGGISLDGIAATGYGGGGGASYTASSGVNTGGNGAPGYIRITW